MLGRTFLKSTSAGAAVLGEMPVGSPALCDTAFATETYCCSSRVRFYLPLVEEVFGCSSLHCEIQNLCTQICRVIIDSFTKISIENFLKKSALIQKYVVTCQTLNITWVSDKNTYYLIQKVIMRQPKWPVALPLYYDCVFFHVEVNLGLKAFSLLANDFCSMLNQPSTVMPC